MNNKILDDNFLDVLTCMSFAIGLINYQENLQQSDNDDIMQSLDKKTNGLLLKLEEDLEQQNVMLKEILNRLEKLENHDS